MTTHFDYSGPAIRVQQSTPIPQFASHFGQDQGRGFAYGGGNGSWSFDQSHSSDAAQMLAAATNGLHAPSLNNRRDRGHQRVSSSSSGGSSGSPSSPFGPATQPMYRGGRPALPKSAAEGSYQHADEASRTYLNTLPTPTQTPTQDTFFAAASSNPSSYPQFQTLDSALAATMALKHAYGHDGNSVTEEDAPGFSHSTRHSVSSFGRNSPATPQTVNGEDFDEGFKSTDLPPVRPGVQIPKYERTLNDMYADELFNPTSAPPSSATPQSAKMKNGNLLSPYHNAMMNERLQQANQARSQSPTASGARGMSPFRQGSPYAQAYGSPQNRYSTAAQLRQKQKAEAEASALARQANRREEREPKTISPKDAMLEYREADEASKVPLFPDPGASAPFGQHGVYAGGNFAPLPVSTAGDAYHQLAAVSNGMGGWSQDQGYAAAPPAQAQFNFAPSSVPGMFHHGLPSHPYQTSMSTAAPEETPEFPAHLTSMESSASEAPPVSSQNSNVTTEPTRPLSTLADTGTYTCTYHGCTQRFETPQKLQRHKREAHRPSAAQQAHQQHPHSPHHPRPTQPSLPHSTSSNVSAATSTSQHVQITPGIGSGMSSAALAERNSQAGPHRCDRINPTTGKPCATVFSRPYDLTRHEDTIHNIKKQKVRCALCTEEKTFSRNDALTRHMRVVHPDVDFPGKHRRRGGRGDD